MKKIVVVLSSICIVLWIVFFILSTRSHVKVAKSTLTTTTGELQITFLDVGQGDSAIIRTPNGKYVLIDAGSFSGATIIESDAGELTTEIDAGKDIILPYLRKNNITELEGIIVSHPHVDHYGGLLSKKLVELTTGFAVYGDYYTDYLYEFLLNAPKKHKEFLSILYEIPVKWYIDPGLPLSMPEYVVLLSLLKAKKIKYIIPKAGDKIDFGDTSITATVLGPQEAGYLLDTPSGVNDSSIVIKIIYGTISVLFTGDIELAAELDLLEKKHELKSTILKVPHHGSRTSSSVPFLDYVRPEVAIISCGRGNPFGHPHSETISTLDNLKITTYRTDQNGTITLTTDGITYKIKTGD